MRSSFALLALAALTLAGCTSDEQSICERLAECDLLVEGLTEKQCEKEATQQVSQERLDLCANCVEEKACKDILKGCRKDCEPGD